jgi:hypothetical protein
VRSALSSGGICLALLLAGPMLRAQAPAAPPGTDSASRAAQRFPQPVRAGDLIGRRVLEPVESRNVVGRVSAVVRRADGRIDLVLEHGGNFGLGGRRIAVPSEALALLGAELEILGYTPAELDRLPTFDGGGTVGIAPDDTIRMGLARPSH